MRWPDVHVLVPGGAGFIGATLARRALALGHRVTVVDNRDMDDNLRATVLLAEWALAIGSPRIVFASTESVYGEEQGRAPFDEDMLPRPLSYYGCSKLACEHYLRVAHREQGLAPPRVRVLRSGPLGGPRARNVGVEHTRGEVVVFIDDDDLPEGLDFLAAALSTLRVGWRALDRVVDLERRGRA